MYNPNYNLDIYCALEFQYSTSGAFKLLYKTEMFFTEPLEWTNYVLWLNFFYLAFVVYYVVVTILEIRAVWRHETHLEKESQKIEDFAKFEQELFKQQRRTKCQNILLFFGIDSENFED